VIFAIFGLVGYLGIYKPAREELKEVRITLKVAEEFQLKIENDMNDLLTKYFEMRVKELIDSILKDIHDETSEASNKMGQLQMYQYEKFDDAQVQKMIEIVKKKNKYSQSILQNLTHSDNIYSEVFFSQCIKDFTFEGNDTIVRFFAKHNKTAYINDIANYIINTQKILNISYAIKSYSIPYLTELFNNDTLVEGTSKFALQELYNTGMFNNNAFEETKIYKKYLSLTTQIIEEKLT
jgi:hypothetical protein